MYTYRELMQDKKECMAIKEEMAKTKKELAHLREENTYLKKIISEKVPFLISFLETHLLFMSVIFLKNLQR